MSRLNSCAREILDEEAEISSFAVRQMRVAETSIGSRSVGISI